MKYAILGIGTLLSFLSAETTLGQENTAVPDTLRPINQSGWAWEIKRPTSDHTTEVGKIVYRLTINSAGELISIELMESTVSEEVERIYREATLKATFRRVGDATGAAEQTSGIITYVLKNREEQVASDSKKQRLRQHKRKPNRNL